VSLPDRDAAVAVELQGKGSFDLFMRHDHHRRDPAVRSRTRWWSAPWTVGSRGD